MKLATYAIYGIVLLACRNFGDATRQVMRYEVLAHDLGRSRLRLEQGVRSTSGTASGASAGPVAIWRKASVPASRHLSRWVAQRPVPIVEIGFSHAALPAWAEYERIFKAPVRFNQPENYARFDPQILDWPLPNADVALFPVLQAHAEQLLQGGCRRSGKSVIGAGTRSHHPNAGARPRPPAGSGRTPRLHRPHLQRKLKTPIPAFRKCSTAPVANWPSATCASPNFDYRRFAYMLGFREQSSFNHVWDWTGVNPAHTANRGNSRARRL